MVVAMIVAVDAVATTAGAVAGPVGAHRVLPMPANGRGPLAEASSMYNGND